jgi:hypothetical protein
MKRFGMVLSVIVVLSFVSTAFGGDLGDGFYLHNVDQFSDVVSVNVSNAEMGQLLDHSTRAEKVSAISKIFYTKFADEYDFLFFVCFSNLGGETNGEAMMINNEVTGIGPVNSYADSLDWGSPSKLKSSLFLEGGDKGIFYGILLHELSHKWMTHIYSSDINDISTHMIGSHWGLSNAGGVLGGFKEVRKVAANTNSYKASISPNKAGFGLTANFDVPYSDIELYLMGLKSAQELRDVGFQLDIYTGGSVDSLWDGSPDGYFTATGKVSKTIDEIISEYGERTPDASVSQKHFKAAVIALTDGSITPNYPRLVSALRWFAGGVNDKRNTQYPNAYNFAQATGGRGTIEIEGLRAGGDGNSEGGGGGGGGGCNAGFGLFGLLLAGLVMRGYRKV